MNGSAVALQLVPETAPAPQTSIEHRIGTATVLAIGVMSQGLLEYWDGGLTTTTRALGGEAVARLFELQQSAPDLDFATMVRVQGLKALRARHAAGPDHAVAFPEAPANEIIDGVLEMLAGVTVAMAS
jgi:hypothetical protein